MNEIEICTIFAEEVAGYTMAGTSATGVPMMKIPTPDGKGLAMEVTKLTTSLATLFNEMQKFCKTPDPLNKWIVFGYTLSYSCTWGHENFICDIQPVLTGDAGKDCDGKLYGSDTMICADTMPIAIMTACIEAKRRLSRRMRGG